MNNEYLKHLYVMRKYAKLLLWKMRQEVDNWHIDKMIIASLIGSIEDKIKDEKIKLEKES